MVSSPIVIAACKLRGWSIDGSLRQAKFLNSAIVLSTYAPPMIYAASDVDAVV